MIDLPPMMDRVTAEHTSRPIRRLVVKSVYKSPQAIIDANLTEQHTRSNMTDLLMQISRVSSSLTAHVDRVTDLLILQFSKELMAWRSKEDRRRVIDEGVFSDIRRYLSDLDSAREFILLVVEDIDQSSYSLQRLVNVLEATAPSKVRSI